MAPSGRDGNRNARYAYLVGRLRGRQITMEEATELFTIMQGMIQAGELARAALMRVPPPPSAVAPSIVPPPPPTGPVTAGGDDLLLVGLLAMGAGAGLLAAMTKRIQDATPPAGSISSPSSNPATTRKG